MDPVETEFMAQTVCHVEIIPKIKVDAIQLMGKTVGPLRPPRKSKIPLWLAQELCRRDLCHLVVPDWINVDTLTQYLDMEKNMPSFTDLPVHYIEISKAVLDLALNSNGQNMQQQQINQQIRSLVYDIQAIRSKKIRDSIGSINDQVIMLNNISNMEISTIRPFLSHAFCKLGQLSE